VNAKELWKLEYQNEIDRAFAARLLGNEGMARVCARRAAGIVVEEYLKRRGFANQTHSAYDHLSIFTNFPNIDQKHKKIVGHFLLRVDKNHKLPSDIDLINEAIWLEKSLLDNTN